MKLYMRVTKDKFELPLIVAESGRELAEILGIRPNVVYSSISHKHKGWVVVEVEDEEDG